MTKPARKRQPPIRWMLAWALLALVACPNQIHAAELPLVAFVIGENEYRTWETLPEFARSELEPRGLRCSFVNASPKEGDNVFTNFAVIKNADLLFISVRRRTPPREMMRLIRAHLAAGKPLIGLRTASHAFGAQPTDASQEGWPTFDAEVLGCRYQGHYNNVPPKSPATLVEVVPSQQSHPALRGISTNQFRVSSHLYKSRDLAATATALVVGRVEDQATWEPVAWTNTNQNRRVFYTSLGSPDDFSQPFFRLLLLNSVFWTLNLPVPSATTPKAAAQEKP